MMKKPILIFCLVLLSTLSFSQTQTFFDSPFGGGGGYTPGWMFTKPNSLNSMLAQAGMPTVSNSGVFTSGGGGFIYIGFIPGLRIGGMGFSGKYSNQSIITPNGIMFFNTETDYSIGGGGLTVEYTFPFIKAFGVSVGATIGGGSMSVEIYKDRGSYTWDGIGNELGGSAISPYDQHRTLKNNFWLISPTINIDIPFYRFLCFRIGAGYNFTLGEEWKLDNNQSISNVPSDFNGRNFFVQTGILIGFFSF